MATKAAGTLRDRREALVREHVETENRHDAEATLTTFSHPRYELMMTGQVVDGHDAVAAMYAETYTALPDVVFEAIEIHHADDAVIVETEMRGTHKGLYRGLPPTGRSVRVRGCFLFMFEGDQLVCERLYLDTATIMRQLGVARDPDTVSGKIEILLCHPITVGRALLGGRRR